MVNSIRRHKGSLTNKLTLTMSGLAMGVVLVVSGSALWRERTNFHKELEYQAELILDTVSIASSNALYFNQFVEAEDIVNGLGDGFRDKQILVAAKLYQTDGRLLADAFAQENPTLNLEPDDFGQKILTENQTVLTWREQKLMAGKPIVVGDKTVGAVSIGLSTQPIQQKLTRTLQEGLMAAMVTGISSVLLARFLSYSITKPLQQLTITTRKISQGQWGQTIELQTNDEITILANAFNHMSAQLYSVAGSMEQQTQQLRHSQQIAQVRADELEHTVRELHRTQEHLIQQEKMSSLGQMVAGVAHEINNPVTFIQGNVDPAREYVEDLLSLITLYQKHYPHPPDEILNEQDAIDLSFLKKDIVKLLSSMGVGAERITAIVNSLRTFSRLDATLCKAVDLHLCLENTLLILGHRLKGRGPRPAIKIVKNYGSLAPVECFAGQINQVFMNLLANAIDALEAAPQLSTPGRERRISIHTAMTTDHQVLIKIGDNGAGMTEEVRSQIFNPFYTTKPMGKGTGLGLAISYQIITDLHGGTITCQSRPGEGTDFLIQIPRGQLAT